MWTSFTTIVKDVFKSKSKERVVLTTAAMTRRELTCVPTVDSVLPVLPVAPVVVEVAPVVPVVVEVAPVVPVVPVVPESLAVLETLEELEIPETIVFEPELATIPEATDENTHTLDAVEALPCPAVSIIDVDCPESCPEPELLMGTVPDV